MQSVLDWLRRHVEQLAAYEPLRGQELAERMLGGLRAAAARGELRLAATVHGLDDGDVGPVVVMLASAERRA